MKLGTAVLLLSKITDQRTALHFFFDLVHVSERICQQAEDQESYPVPIAILAMCLRVGSTEPT